MGKTPTHRSITSVLLEAGFTKSQQRQGSPVTDGFVVRAGGEGTVRVHHVIAQRGPADTDARFRSRGEERYAKVIEAAGYAAERGTGGYFSPVGYDGSIWDHHDGFKWPHLAAS